MNLFSIQLACKGKFACKFCSNRYNMNGMYECIPRLQQKSERTNSLFLHVWNVAIGTDICILLDGIESKILHFVLVLLNDMARNV